MKCSGESWGDLVEPPEVAAAGERQGRSGWGSQFFQILQLCFFLFSTWSSILDFRGAKGSEAEPNLEKTLIWKTSKVLSLGPVILKSLLLIRNFRYLLAR